MSFAIHNGTLYRRGWWGMHKASKSFESWLFSKCSTLQTKYSVLYEIVWYYEENVRYYEENVLNYVEKARASS